MTKTVLNWSSGKDAALAYSLLAKDPALEVTHLLTTMNTEQQRIVMHGVREKLLDMQANRMGLPLKKIWLPASPDNTQYQQAMRQTLSGLQQEGVTTAAFGDIFLEDLKQYREQQLQTIGIQAAFPLWKKDTRALVAMLEHEGIEAMIVCVDARVLGKEFLGRKIDTALINDLPPGVDPCGEHGEFHSFVYQAPWFSSPITVRKKEIVYREYPSGNNAGGAGFYFLDIDAED